MLYGFNQINLLKSLCFYSCPTTMVHFIIFEFSVTSRRQVHKTPSMLRRCHCFQSASRTQASEQTEFPNHFSQLWLNFSFRIQAGILLFCSSGPQWKSTKSAELIRYIVCAIEAKYTKHYFRKIFSGIMDEIVTFDHLAFAELEKSNELKCLQHVI